MNAMSDTSRIAVVLGAVMVPLLVLALVVGSSGVLIVAIVLALVALFFAGRALGHDAFRPPS
jgi:hypothetical protein